MIFTVAIQGARATKRSIWDEFQPAVGGRRDIVAIEINEARTIGHTVRIMAGGARSLVVNDVLAVKFKTLI